MRYALCDPRARYQDAIAAAFRPELIGRIDRAIVFESLSRDEVHDIARLAVAEIGERRGLGRSQIELEIDDDVVARLASGGYSAELGARALRRHLESELITPLAELITGAGAAAEGAVARVVVDDGSDGPRARSAIAELRRSGAP